LPGLPAHAGFRNDANSSHSPIETSAKAPSVLNSSWLIRLVPRYRTLPA
jgi:hypothetical protein